MSRIEVVPTTPAHVAELAGTMRPADVEELAGVGYEPLAALTKAVAETPEPWTGLVDGRVCAIFGVAPITADEGSPWLLGSPLLLDIAIPFLRHTRRFVDAWKKQFRLLHNFVSPANTASILWLGWLGFSVASEAQPHGPAGTPMLYFALKGE